MHTITGTGYEEHYIGQTESYFLEKNLVTLRRVQIKRLEYRQIRLRKHIDIRKKR